MDGRKLLILGGYGTAGSLIARGLLRKTNLELILAGRNLERAQAFAGELNSEFPGSRVAAEKVDASRSDELVRALHKACMVLVASSTSMFTDAIVRAALDSGTDYYDIQYSSPKEASLKSVVREIEDRGLCFITDGGFHPGLPGVMVRWAASAFDSIEKAVVGSLIRIDWKSIRVGRATVAELLSSLRDYDPSAFVDGRWKKASFFSSKGYLAVDFGTPFGRQYCAPMFLEEMRIVQELYPSLKDTGFYVGGFNWFVDYFVFPAAFVSMKLWPALGQSAFSSLMLYGVKKFSKPPYATMLNIIATGMKDGRRSRLVATLSHEDGYVLTALPVVASLMQYFGGGIRRPGLFTQANIVEPARLLSDMVAMGAAWKADWAA